METTTAMLAGGLGGAVVAGVFGLLSNLATKKSENKRHRLTLATQMAVESWKRNFDAKQPGEKMMPMDLYLLHMHHLTEVLTKEKKLSRERAREIAEEAINFTLSVSIPFELAEEEMDKTEKGALPEDRAGGPGARVYPFFTK